MQTHPSGCFLPPQLRGPAGTQQEEKEKLQGKECGEGGGDEGREDVGFPQSSSRARRSLHHAWVQIHTLFPNECACLSTHPQGHCGYTRVSTYPPLYKACLQHMRVFAHVYTPMHAHIRGAMHVRTHTHTKHFPTISYTRVDTLPVTVVCIAPYCVHTASHIRS